MDLLQWVTCDQTGLFLYLLLPQKPPVPAKESASDSPKEGAKAECKPMAEPSDERDVDEVWRSET